MVDKAKRRKEEKKWSFRWTLSAPSQDPYLLIDFDNDSLAICFDCGVRIWGNVKTILKVKHLFITHAHIDHIIGFDHIIRALLGEDKTLHIHGPAGIHHRLTSKLNGYDWDRSAEQELILKIHEYADGKIITRTHACNQQFEMTMEPEVRPWSGAVVEEKRFSVWAVSVNHGGSPCNAYVMKEKDCYRIDKDGLTRLGVRPGPWVGQLLNAFKNDNLDTEDISISSECRYTARELADELIRVETGKTVVYITDTVFRKSWLEELSCIADGADLVACESTFLNEDESLAEKYHHLTSVQAGNIARTLNAERLFLFHISSRYHPKIFRAVIEARRIFSNTDFIHLQNRKKSRNQNTINN